MPLMKFSRARLAALAATMLLGIVLSLPTYHASYAQAPAAAPAAAADATAPAAPAAAPSPPACRRHRCSKSARPNSGDTAWMLTSMAIVLMMTIPGLALFYGGMVRKKNVGDTVMTSFAITCLISILWLLFTYSIAFRGGIAVHRRARPRRAAGHSQRHIDRHRQSQSAGADHSGKRLFDVPTDLRDHHRGADRGILRGAHEVLGHAVVHRPVGDLRLFAGRALGVGTGRHLQHRQCRRQRQLPGWVKVLDFAGGTVVHVNSGTAGLMAALMLGKRKESGPPHNVVLTMIGASLLWVGWFGFNAGSAVSAGMQAGMAMLVTHTATATAGFTWMLLEWVLRGKPTVLGICSGAVAGLVAITPASGFVGPMGSFAIGIAAGFICYWGCTGLKHMFGYDDALDAFGVHGIGGAAGAILTGVFAVSEYGGTAGVIEGNGGQVLNQCIGVGTVFIYDAVVTLIILKVVDLVIGLRVSAEVERDGLDLALHGETVQ